MSAYTINWETYRTMQDRIASLESLNKELNSVEADYKVAYEMILLEAEREMDRLKTELEKLKAE